MQFQKQNDPFYFLKYEFPFQLFLPIFCTNIQPKVMENAWRTFKGNLDIALG